MTGSLLVSYDLRGPGASYQALYVALTALNAVRIQESVWLIPNPFYTAMQIRDYLAQTISPHDQVFIARLTGEVALSGLHSQVSQVGHRL